MKYLSFILGNWIYLIHSLIVKSILRLKGFKIGKNFKIRGVPLLKLNSENIDISFGDNITILGDIDIRTREKGSIHFGNNVKIEENCRLVAAKKGKIVLKDNVVVTCNAIINGGADIKLDENSIIGPRNTINANEHVFELKKDIKDQGFIHKPIYIGKDCWTGANVTIAKGVNIKDKSIIAANSFVNKDTEEASINGGVPSKFLSKRN